MTRCRIEVWSDGERSRTRLRPGLLRGQVTHGPPDRITIGLIATQALLLSGDRVEIEVVVGPGCRLDLFDVAGTVAYGRGGPSGWHVTVRVGERGRLTWRGEPFVVAAEAAVERSLDVTLAASAVLSVRETVVLGRTGELGGALHSRTRVRVEADDVLVEELSLAPGRRALPGLLGAARVLDSRLTIGAALDPTPGVPRLHLVDGGTLDRWLGPELAASPLSTG